MPEWLLPMLVGFTLGLVPGWYSRRKAFGTHKKAMQAELLIVEKMATTYIEANIAAPLYRLPDMAFEAGYQKFIAETSMDQDEAMAISVYYLKVLEINRGLDYANERADLYAGRAWEALGSLPQDPAVEALREAVAYTVGRDR